MDFDDPDEICGSYLNRIKIESSMLLQSQIEVNRLNQSIEQLESQIDTVDEQYEKLLKVYQEENLLLFDEQGNIKEKYADKFVRIENNEFDFELQQYSEGLNRIEMELNAYRLTGTTVFIPFDRPHLLGYRFDVHYEEEYYEPYFVFVKSEELEGKTQVSVVDHTLPPELFSLGLEENDIYDLNVKLQEPIDNSQDLQNLVDTILRRIKMFISLKLK